MKTWSYGKTWAQLSIPSKFCPAPYPTSYTNNLSLQKSVQRQIMLRCLSANVHLQMFLVRPAQVKSAPPLTFSPFLPLASSYHCSLLLQMQFFMSTFSDLAGWLLHCSPTETTHTPMQCNSKQEEGLKLKRGVCKAYIIYIKPDKPQVDSPPSLFCIHTLFASQNGHAKF